MKVKFLGQNCFLFEYKGKTIITDPFYNYQKEKSGFDITAQKIDYVLITHAHGDHITDVAEVLQHHPETVVIGQPEICGYFSHKNNIDINYGGSTKVEDMVISMLPALHTSSFPDGSYGGQPCGYMLKGGESTVYFAGDTGVMAEMALFPELYGRIDVAILPIGGHYTMCPKQASFAASKLLKVNKVVGCHFDTFPPIAINHNEAKTLFGEVNIELTLPEVGEVFEL